MSVAVLGAGAHGHELARILDANPVAGGALLCDDQLGKAAVSCREGARDRPWVVGSIWPEARREMAGRFTDPDTYSHPWNGGTVVSAGAVISGDALVGNHVFVGPNVVISHGCRVNAFCSVIAGTLIGGEAMIYQDVVLGAGSIIIHGGITIGAGAFVGAGAVVIDDVPPGAVVAGNPGRIIADDWSYRDMAAGRRGRKGLATPR